MAVVEEDESGVGDAHAAGAVDEAEEGAGVEEEEAGDAGVAVELADGLGEEGVAEGVLLEEAVGAGEAAGVAGGAAVEVEGVDHAVAVEEVVTGEGAMNALSREGCRHFEAFDQVDEDFERDIYKVEDPVVKESAGALYDRMWRLYGREVVRERAETARAQVTLLFVWRLLYAGCACVC